MNFRFPVFLLIAILMSCNNQKADTKVEEEKLRQTIKDWTMLLDKDSLERTVSFWTDDAIMMMPGQPVIKGKKAIEEMVANSRKIPGFKIVWEPPTEVDVSENGDRAYTFQRNQITMNDSLGKPMTQYNKSVSIWKKQADGSWKDAVVIWNAESPQNK
ncbi:MAG TPA: DUF4440 domain-containing protein [Niabella sp.]|nr:DUF4440 domain-containing protein [Niabella sp.]HRP33306.1 DUF4440 domain-containing protein [Agriterribacter sp.]